MNSGMCDNHESATFAGGCFWCMVSPFDELPGIKTVISGYTGGYTENPTYEEVCSGTTGHVEAVQITFDPEVFPYKRLLKLYWQQIDPTDAQGQFINQRSSYRTIIFYHNEKQKQEAEASKQKLQESGKFNQPIVTQVLPATLFYEAEDYHQDYYKNQPENYKAYRRRSGREEFIGKHWGNKQ